MGEITLRKALDDYKSVHMPYRNFAGRTREEYQNDLYKVVKYLEQVGINYVKQLGLPIIERYVADLEQKGLTSQTRRRNVASIRSFLLFLYQDDYIDVDIAKRIVPPFLENTIPRVLTPGECDRIRKACTGNIRDTAIIELLLQTGIKLSELIHLRLGDIVFEEKEFSQSGFMRILGSRGKKERVIPLNTKASFALKCYLSEREASTTDILFLNRFDEALSERGVQKMLRRYLKKAEIGRASIQTLRHTFGAHHIAKGTDPKTIQDVMGLKDHRSTGIYQSLAKEVVSRELQENAL